jgi:hypothetical protein
VRKWPGIEIVEENWVRFPLFFYAAVFPAAGRAASRRAARSVIEETAQWSKTTGARAFSAGLLSGVAAK